MRVLIIEDQPDACRPSCSHLKRRGFVVDVGARRDDPVALVAATSYDVILLDLVLPDSEGAPLVGRLRRVGNLVPVIILAARDAAADRIRLFEAGADDCLSRPFDLDELVARIRVSTRRGRLEVDRPVTFADLSFYPARRVAVVKGRPVMLRSRELALLEILMRTAGQPSRRSSLMSSLYSTDEEIGSNSLDVHVHHLRRRLAAAGASVTISTIRGIGYALQVQDSERGQEADQTLPSPAA